MEIWHSLWRVLRYICIFSSYIILSISSVYLHQFDNSKQSTNPLYASVFSVPLSTDLKITSFLEKVQPKWYLILFTDRKGDTSVNGIASNLGSNVYLLSIKFVYLSDICYNNRGRNLSLKKLSISRKNHRASIDQDWSTLNNCQLLSNRKQTKTISTSTTLCLQPRDINHISANIYINEVLQFWKSQHQKFLRGKSRI